MGPERRSPVASMAVSRGRRARAGGDPAAMTKYAGEQVLTELVLGVLVLGLLIYRQLVARRVSGSSIRISLVLGAIGLVDTWGFLREHHGGPLTVLALAGSLALAVGFGAARARTVRIWWQGGAAWSRG
jgi:hypothetical protein